MKRWYLVKERRRYIQKKLLKSVKNKTWDRGVWCFIQFNVNSDVYTGNVFAIKGNILEKIKVLSRN